MMSEMENDLRTRTRRSELQAAILTSLEVAGVIALAVVAPNLLQLFKKRYTSQSVHSSAKLLEKKGLVTWELRNGKSFLKLTTAGENFLSRGRMMVARSKRWDGKWRLVSFDISQARSAQRTRLRQTLREIGFERLQDSVWVFPYDCEDLITLLKADYGLGKEVLYIIADTIENDRALRGRFGLKRR
ncbi:MAG: CRISPR-associated endonuclease Cas2 [Candidatus Pacebacteria bacterium]|nr:CRISPR-associated endonuclease Cas2 [Candidatus Paceibacterota bacterium]